ncbi:MAG: sigma-70 family RNA polymerase sigma factor [Ectothiorhodospiraceae bacterium]|nr:sigma-70 family RNA polymerase sigma factor [Ectothiorhodospiraceae bacterium]
MIARTRPTEPDPLPDLLARCVLRDQTAFAALYQATSAKLYGIILRILKRESWAEEALQETYLKIWNGASGYSAVRGRPMTWMISIARNQALDYVRRSEYRASGEETELSDTLPGADSPHQAAEISHELERLRRCLAQLSDDQRACFLLVYHEGFTPMEVAGLRQWPLGTVKTWIRRGLQRLKACLE